MNTPVKSKNTNKKILIGVAVVVAVYAGYVNLVKSPVWTTTGTTQSGSQVTTTTPVTNGKWSDWLLTEFIKIAKQTNPDLTAQPVQQYGNFQLLKFSCVITPEGMRNFLGTMNSPTDASRKMNETDLTTEQIKILAVQMKDDCENANLVTVGKGLLFLKNNGALSLDDIAPSKIVTEIRKRMDVDAQQKVSRELDVIESMLSYRKNINTLLNSEVQKQLLSQSYTSLKEASDAQKNEDAKKLVTSLAEVVTFYSK